MIRWLVALVLLGFVVQSIGYVGITQRPISTADPVFIHVHSEIPAVRTPSKYWGAIQKPYPTNSWLSNLGFNPFPVTVFPYIIKPAPEEVGSGITVCLPVLAVTPNNLAYVSTQHDDFLLYVGLTGDRVIESYSLLGVTTFWPPPSSSPNNYPTLRVPWVQGNPFVTAFVSGGVFNFSTSSEITTVNDIAPSNGQAFAGNKFRIAVKDLSTGNTQLWVVWVLNSDVTLTYYDNARQDPTGPHPVLVGRTTLPPSVEVVFRIVCVKDQSPIPVLEQYLSNIVVGGDVTIPEDINTNQVPITFTWHAVDSARNPVVTEDILMMGLPHHDNCIDRNGLKQYGLLPNVWRAIKGPMLGYVGSKWNLIENLTTIGWFARSPIDPGKIEVIRSALKSEALNFLPRDNDTYGYGKYVSALARLVLIAEQLGEVQIQNNLLTQLKNQLGPWLYRVTYRATFLYDVTWGGTISANGWLDSTKDFGNGIFNDHHYHNGYYIYAAAVVLKYDPNWVWGPHAIDLIRDIANPSAADPFFPITRHKDWYVGHSWAQGLDQTLDGKNQESTSEAVHAYYGIMLYGMATNNNFLKNIGRVLLATEMRSVHRYYHIMPGSDIYPPPFSNNGIVGIMWSDKADYATFFGNEPAYIHCIQMIPFTPISEELLPKSWVQNEYPVLAPRLGAPITYDWRGYILLDWAILAPQDAWNVITTYPDSAFNSGNSRTSAYYWIATRP